MRRLKSCTARAPATDLAKTPPATKSSRGTAQRVDSRRCSRKSFKRHLGIQKLGSWLLEQARVTEVVPAQVLRSLWQRYDRNRDNVLDETELECLVGDLNQLRSGHRHVSEEQLDAVMSIVRGIEKFARKSIHDVRRIHAIRARRHARMHAPTASERCR